LIAGIIENKFIFTGLGCLDLSFIGDVAACKIEILRKVDHMSKVSPLQMLEID